MYRNFVIIMTALVPTIGHKYLIDWAINYNEMQCSNPAAAYSNKICVLINTRDCEPVDGKLRFEALKNAYSFQQNVEIKRYHGDVPQNPSEYKDFWTFWAGLIKNQFPEIQKNRSCFVASENYGVELAKALSMDFLPCNINRDILPFHSTDIRKDPFTNFDKVLPEFRKYMKKTITMFGAESCGKTTMAKKMSEIFNGHFVPEWAREYLETVGPEITQQKMYHIEHGQAASQKNVDLMNDKCLTFQDTDLFSTLGYYEIFKKNSLGVHSNTSITPSASLREKAVMRSSDLYILMNDKIPFTEDQLRYGKTVRESDNAFWKKILLDNGLPFYEVEFTEINDQEVEISHYIWKWYMDQFGDMDAFVRT